MNSETVKILKTRETLEGLLERNPEYRDDDERLAAAFWYKQLYNAGYDLKTLSAYDLLKIYASNQLLTSADTIVRARAKLQENRPDLRGKKYNERHKDGVEVANEIVKH